MFTDIRKVILAELEAICHSLLQIKMQTGWVYNITPSWKKLLNKNAIKPKNKVSLIGTFHNSMDFPPRILGKNIVDPSPLIFNPYASIDSNKGFHLWIRVNLFNFSSLSKNKNRPFKFCRNLFFLKVELNSQIPDVVLIIVNNKIANAFVDKWCFITDLIIGNVFKWFAMFSSESSQLPI